MRDSGLTLSQRSFEIAAARLVRRRDHRQQSKTYRVPEGGKDSGHVTGLDFGEDVDRQWTAAIDHAGVVHVYGFRDHGTSFIDNHQCI